VVTPAAFVASYIGHPYKKTGLHCWELTRRCQADVFGRELPAVLAVPDTPAGIARLMARRDKHPGWHRIDRPKHGSVVFMTRAGHGPERAAIHAGVFLALDGGGILHTDNPHGVVFESISELKARGWAGFSYHLPD
jgi:hypothetical protein